MPAAPEAWLRGPIHTQRHTGQVITTAKIVRAGGAPHD